MVSLDTAVHPILGNLAKGTNFDHVRRLAQQGLVAGVLTGPPCETWSAARHLQDPDCPGPRPLRSAEFPWSLPERTGKELKQRSMGTELLTNSWIAETATVSNGGAAIMEHPWENSQDDRASVWRTDAHESFLMALPGAHRRYVEQYRFGAAGVKPTCLRSLNLGDPDLVGAVLHDGMEPWRVKPTTQLIGKDEKGAYRTAAAKGTVAVPCSWLSSRDYVPEPAQKVCGLLLHATPWTKHCFLTHGVRPINTPDCLSFQTVRVCDIFFRIQLARPRQDLLWTAEWKK